jgi:rhodanese-related sulfurtransferase
MVTAKSTIHMGRVLRLVLSKGETMNTKIVSHIGLLAVLLLFTIGCNAVILQPAGQPPADVQSQSKVDAPAEMVSLAPAATPNAQGFVDITVDQLSGLLADKNFTMVNVHIPYEGELPQTDLFIPYNEITDHLDQLPAKDAPIVLYCRSGSMSTEAGAVLADLGYTNVYELDGGFNAWAAAGHELLQNEANR